MGTFRRKIETVDARQLTEENADILAQWCGGNKVTELGAYDSSMPLVGINVPALSGNFRVSEGDYLVKYENGVFVAYSKYDFERTFEEA